MVDGHVLFFIFFSLESCFSNSLILSQIPPQSVGNGSGVQVVGVQVGRVVGTVVVAVDDEGDSDVEEVVVLGMGVG